MYTCFELQKLVYLYNYIYIYNLSFWVPNSDFQASPLFVCKVASFARRCGILRASLRRHFTGTERSSVPKASEGISEAVGWWSPYQQTFSWSSWVGFVQVMSFIHELQPSVSLDGTVTSASRWCCLASCLVAVQGQQELWYLAALKFLQLWHSPKRIWECRSSCGRHFWYSPIIYFTRTTPVANPQLL